MKLHAFFKFGNKMEQNGQLKAPVALVQVKDPPPLLVTIVQWDAR
jgi:hypothetical protein